MSEAILPPQARALIDRPEFAILGTINPDGSPHQCVMWVGRDGDHLLMSTKAHRRQYRNLLADPRASVLVQSREKPEVYVDVRGRAELGGSGANELILTLASAYLGRTAARWTDEEERSLIRIVPERVLLHG
jgi:PPOX class probable F420-dependent enzyme